MCVSTGLLRSMGIILVRSPLYFILRAKFAKPISSVLARSSCGVVAWGCSTGPDCEFCGDCPFIGGNGTSCREPTVTPINSAISSRLFPRSTRFLICWSLSGVNCLPRRLAFVIVMAAPFGSRPVIVVCMLGLVSDARCDGHHEMADSRCDGHHKMVRRGDGKQLPAQ